MPTPCHAAPLNLRRRSALLAVSIALLPGLAMPAFAQKAKAPAATANSAAAAAAAAASAPAPYTGNPYEAVVPVDDESDKSRDVGMRLALTEVLKRAVGRADPAFAPVLGRAPQMVQQYGFEKDPATAATQFRASFDAQAVDAALKQQRLPVFGVNPALIDAWIVEVDGLRDSADYARVLQLFTDMRGINRVDVDDLRDGHLRLRMIVEGGTERAAQLATAGGVLRSLGPDHYAVAGK
ncbi:MAG: DUF2066 domain-containing protein [Panacagrimonas sp.]